MGKAKQNKMDRYVIKNPASSSSSSPSKQGGPRLKQTTITSLRGVVVVDDILRHKSLLQLSTATKDEKLASLEELSKKIPPRHVMMSTKIGKVINKLRCHEDDDIQRAAKKIYVQWKNHFVEHKERPMIEVKCDLKTESLRNKGREMLAEALASENATKLAETIERENFQAHKQLLTNSYKRTMRNLVFILRNQPEVREKVLLGEITVTGFVKDNQKT